MIRRKSRGSLNLSQGLPQVPGVCIWQSCDAVDNCGTSKKANPSNERGVRDLGGGAKSKVSKI